MEDIGFPPKKSNGIFYYNATYLELEETFNSKHYIHSMDEYEDVVTTQTNEYIKVKENKIREYENIILTLQNEVKCLKKQISNIEHYDDLFEVDYISQSSN